MTREHDKYHPSSQKSSPRYPLSLKRKALSALKKGHSLAYGLHVNDYLQSLCVLRLFKSIGKNGIIRHFRGNLFLRDCSLTQIPLFLIITFSKMHSDVPTSSIFTFLTTARPNISCQKSQKVAHWNERKGLILGGTETLPMIYATNQQQPKRKPTW